MIFEVETVIKKRIRLTKERWKKIITEKHPIMYKYIEDIQITMREPDTIHKSRWDDNVLLFYRKVLQYYVCVVVKSENSTGFVITTYLTDKIKIGEMIWKK